MKPFFSAAIIVASITIGATIPARAQANNPILEELRPQLQAAMRKVAPDAKWELKGNELTASYKTKVSTDSPKGAAQPEIGPTADGFILRVRAFSQLPNFAVEIPIETPRDRWRTFTARINLRMDENATFRASEPEITQTDWKNVLGDRIEFLPVSQDMSDKLKRLVEAFKSKNGRYFIPRFSAVFREQLPVRYDVAIALADLQEAMPELLENKATRIRALQAATAKAERELSPAEIESLDSDVRDLQTEFQREIGRLEAPFSTGPAHGGPQPQKPRIIAAKVEYLVVTVSQGLRANLINPASIANEIRTRVQVRNKELDDK